MIEFEYDEFEKSLFKADVNCIIYSTDVNNDLTVVEELCMKEPQHEEIVNFLNNRSFKFKKNIRFPVYKDKDMNTCILTSIPSLPFIGIANFLEDLRSSIYMETVSGSIVSSAKELLTHENYKSLISHIDSNVGGFTNRTGYLNSFSNETKRIKYESVILKIKQNFLNSIAYGNNKISPITDRYLYLECNGVFLNIYVGESFWKYIVENRKETQDDRKAYRS